MYVVAKSIRAAVVAAAAAPPTLILHRRRKNEGRKEGKEGRRVGGNAFNEVWVNGMPTAAAAAFGAAVCDECDARECQTATSSSSFFRPRFQRPDCRVAHGQPDFPSVLGRLLHYVHLGAGSAAIVRPSNRHVSVRSPHTHPRERKPQAHSCGNCFRGECFPGKKKIFFLTRRNFSLDTSTTATSPPFPVPENAFPGCLTAAKSEAPEVFVRPNSARRAAILGCDSNVSTSTHAPPRLYKNSQGEYVQKKPVVSDMSNNLLHKHNTTYFFKRVRNHVDRIFAYVTESRSQTGTADALRQLRDPDHLTLAEKQGWRASVQRMRPLRQVARNRTADANAEGQGADKKAETNGWRSHGSHDGGRGRCQS
jgi:hypothetical protein